MSRRTWRILGVLLGAAVLVAAPGRSTAEDCPVVRVDEVLRVIDGDTFVARVARTVQWQQVTVTVAAVERVRVLGVDAWELDDPRGAAARAFTEAWLGRGPITLTACARDHFGRVLAVVTRGGEDLADALVTAGHGVRR